MVAKYGLFRGSTSVQQGILSFSITESIGFHLGITWNWRLLRASTRYVDDHGKEHRILERRTALALTGGVLW